ncbi:MAG: PD40 domain-containing protein [Flavobacteriaceae bacterium]|nr:PD40 domain-containing protein [Flavobacteriaceae bacterium]MCB0474459.1 PD40 domain-containing protein [Flavobacteriaceae bacterium]
MKKGLLILLFGISQFTYSQEETEVYLFDLVKKDSTIGIENPINISNNEGYYDNQPSFLLDGSGILFTSTRNGQTDIALYNLENATMAWLTDTPGNEYSAIQSPSKKYFSAIYLDTTGTQRLWLYPFSKRTPKLLLENLEVGYYVWFDKRIVVSFVLGDPPTLEVSNLKYKIKYPIDKNIGRSLLKIPNSDLISMISYEHEDPEVYAINPVNSEKEYLADPLEGSQDIAWTPDGTMIMGKDDTLYKLKPSEDKSWIPFAHLNEFHLSGITRLAISPLGNKITVVVSENKKNIP